MIGHLDGRIIDLQPGLVVLEAGGVGYEIHLPVSAHALLFGQDRATLYVHTHVREDVLALYGFPTRRERDVFRLLLGVSGVGPRTALALLSGLTPDDLGTAVEAEHWRRLAAVPGIGRRTAERLIVELKGKLAAGARPTRATAREDAVSALVNLGYPVRAAEEAVGDLLRAEPQMDLSELLRRSLQALIHS